MRAHADRMPLPLGAEKCPSKNADPENAAKP